ncbi:MAG: efflux RND transporter periplasmic adaptor subunit [Simplicispira suum]|uniref:efflux RND transporter periplasmic adaptor subunit n=1 Tax=Simplicispira suum TaxID=2109915 RepID=UPI001C6CECA0|nr:efflux RND transporter periplasmic adaptor subunit [Simplicispira suum]MBW7833923.1 efflux RND transporter periplasmic adaptor subunit [Simplicispira suum]
MASRTMHFATAGSALAVAVFAAWWLQRPAPASPDTAARPTAAAASGGQAKPASVETAAVQQRDLAQTVQAVGSLRSRRSVVLRPEISGRIVKLGFSDGQRVHKGALLVQLDDQLPRAQVAQAQAELSIARANDKRNRELVAQGFVSQRALDESAASVQVAQAKLALAEATAARLRILAPFDGIAGIGQLSVGEYIKDGADIVNIEDMDTMLVDFRLPERYQSLVRVGQSVALALDALPGAQFTAEVRALDPQIDANGRSLAVRASLANPALRLRPGMFARVSLELARRSGALVVPEEAIVPQSEGAIVFKLVAATDDSSVAQRVPVVLGLRGDGFVEVTQGLAVGDVVVTAGQQRLQKDATRVRVADAAARPAERAASR